MSVGALKAELASYAALFVRSARASFAYRQAILTSLLSAGVSYAVPLLVWRQVYAASPHAPSVPSATMFPYLLLAGCLNYAFSMNVENRVGQRIRTGMLATDLLKPVDFQLAQLSQALGDGLFNVMLCAPIFLVGLVALGRPLLPPDVEAVCGFLASAVLSFFIMFSISFVFVQAAFFTYSGYGVLAARNALQQTFSGLSAPLVLFPAGLRAVSVWLPFRHTIHTPLSIYLGWTRGGDIVRLLGEQCAWALGIFLLGKLILSRALRHLEIQGG